MKNQPILLLLMSLLPATSAMAQARTIKVNGDDEARHHESCQAMAEAQYQVLADDLSKKDRFKRYESETFHPASLILDTDRDPLDIILRRTRVLLEDIRQMPRAPKMKKKGKELAALEKKASETDPSDHSERQTLFGRVHALRGKIAFSNPLLDFDRLLFIKRERATFNHMCDQYYGTYAVPGGGVFILSDPFGAKPEVKNLLEHSLVQSGHLQGEKLEGGGFLSPELSYDGKTIFLRTSRVRAMAAT